MPFRSWGGVEEQNPLAVQQYRLGTPGRCPGPSCDGHGFWPPDLSPYRRVGIFLDVMLFKPVVGSGLANPSYDRRYDIGANGSVNILDVLPDRPVLQSQRADP